MTDPGNSIEAVRARFKPEPIRVLLVGESPPAGGTFFYNANSNLYRYTEEAFAAVFGRQFGPGEGFLEFFVELGCYLDDLCAVAVNHLDKGERELQRTAGIASLSARLRAASPQAVVAVMKAIEPHVQQAIDQAGLSQIPVFALPFPAQGNQRKYVAGLAETLRDPRIQSAFMPTR
jgi:hypothetical protein